MEQTSKLNFPTEVVELPSRGLIYPVDSPLSSGQVEIKYMTAKEEDILTNQNYIQKGIVIEKLLKSLIVTPFEYNELLAGDKNAIFIAARILGYGKDYTFNYLGNEYTVDLTTLKNRPIDESVFTRGRNEFEFTLPATDIPVTFKLLTHADEQAIEAEIEGLKKINKDNITEATTRMKYTLTSVNGDRNSKTIRNFVDTALLARDARALREYIRSIQPNVDTTVYPEGGPDGGIELPFGITFLWPDARV